MRIPDRVRACIETLLGARVTDAHAVSGGSINHAAMVEAGSDRVFAKWNADAAPGFFAAEADGLRRLGASGLRVPAVLAVDEVATPRVLLLAYVPAAGRERGVVEGAMVDAGRSLARLHGARGHAPGLDQDNYIGRLAQDNQPLEAPDRAWVSFFVRRRVMPLASVLPAVLRARVERFDFASHLSEPEGGCALLHGDLWGGNLVAGADGQGWFVDPAVYRGHPEVDLAMTRLFGGFSPCFYDAYQSVAGRFDATLDARLDVLNLYPLLVHAHLFGGGYVGQIQAVMDRYGA